MSYVALKPKDLMKCPEDTLVDIEAELSAWHAQEDDPSHDIRNPVYSISAEKGTFNGPVFKAYAPSTRTYSTRFTLGEWREALEDAIG